MAIEWQKKMYKKAPKLPESTGFIATSKLQPVNKVEKVTKCCTAENSYQDSILDLNRWTLALGRTSPPPLEAILVIFGRRALIFFGFKALGKI